MHNIFTLIIVDDEETIRQGLKTYINWKELGFKIEGEASDGKEAIILIETKKPNVILTDIRMENMDGMELIEYIYKNHPDIKVILISGYSNLEYYQKALKFMIFDYILKPTKIDVIKEVFTKLYTSLEEQNEKELLIENMKTQLYSSLPLAKEQFLSQLVKGQFKKETILSYKANFNLTLPTENFRLISFALQKEESPVKGIADKLNKQFHYFFFVNSGIIFSIFEEKKEIKKEIQKIVNFLEKTYKKRITVSVSVKGEDINDIGLLYNQICAIQNEHLFTLDKSSILFFDEIENNYNRFDNLTEIDVTNIITALQNGDVVELNSLISAFFSTLEEKPVPYDYLSYILNKIYYSAFLTAYNGGLNVSPLPDFNLQLSQKRELSEKKAFILEKLEYLAEEFQNNNLNNSNKTIVLINKIIAKEYKSNNMSLTYLSNKTGKSEAYISAFYKECEGVNILEKITTLRIEEAKNKLSKTNEKIYEIAKKIGYSDVSYFCKLFKKTIGVSPAEYRRNNP